MTDDLDALVRRLTWHREHVVTGKLVYANEDGPDAADAITALRAQLAEANARADRAEAALAAQVEDACAVIDAHSEYDQSVCCDGRECGCQGASVHDTMKHFIRQPHDRTALDRMLAEAEARGYELAKAEATKCGWHLRRYDLAKRDAELAKP